MSVELNTLKSDLSSKKQQLTQHHSHVISLNNKIDKIEVLMKEFTQFKSDAKDLRDDVKKDAGQDYDYWKGNLLDDYQDIVKEDLVKEGYKHYIDKIDDNLDSLNNAKMHLQNEIYHTEGLIGDLKSAINWLGTKIENLMN